MNSSVEMRSLEPAATDLPFDLESIDELSVEYLMYALLGDREDLQHDWDTAYGDRSVEFVKKAIIDNFAGQSFEARAAAVAWMQLHATGFPKALKNFINALDQDFNHNPLLMKAEKSLADSLQKLADDKETRETASQVVKIVTYVTLITLFGVLGVIAVVVFECIDEIDVGDELVKPFANPILDQDQEQIDKAKESITNIKQGIMSRSEGKKSEKVAVFQKGVDEADADADESIEFQKRMKRFAEKVSK